MNGEKMAKRGKFKEFFNSLKQTRKQEARHYEKLLAINVNVGRL